METVLFFENFHNYCESSDSEIDQSNLNNYFKNLKFVSKYQQ